ncbi:hypothetical protein N825_36440 [Skermanella stibiiresistens SB22]|uniref:Uncharacterized protein n=1 Tax=Skermanella stibiiresistens SB22 TaxID=1385369 RepID=W9H2E2_9PROT|nr:hypothetical protein [Skermanella stibiiresistens]EWY40214.1 hypothetical protein N825_36440 [Skermanella stibiiresistens SB22]
MTDGAGRHESPAEDWRFATVPGSAGERRDFRITLGLREGWKRTGRIYDIEEAVRAAHDWMKRKADAGQPFLSGMFTRGEVVYAWPGVEGTMGSAGSDREPVAIFTGEALPLYSGDLDDDAICALLNELACEMGRLLGQEDLHLAYKDRAWVLRRVLD